jgi:hypothetical protein
MSTAILKLCASGSLPTETSAGMVETVAESLMWIADPSDVSASGRADVQGRPLVEVNTPGTVFIVSAEQARQLITELHGHWINGHPPHMLRYAHHVTSAIAQAIMAAHAFALAGPNRIAR